MTVREMMAALAAQNPDAIMVRMGGDRQYVKLRGVEPEQAQKEGQQLFEYDPSTWAAPKVDVVVIS